MIVLSEALKTNTTLTQLDLTCEGNRTISHKWHPSTVHSFFIINKSTGNRIEETGIASLIEALKSNTILTQLNLGCEDKRNNTNGAHRQTLFSNLINQQAIKSEKEEQNHWVMH